MAEKRQYEYFLLRYVPDVVKGEYVNFGLVAVENKDQGAELVEVRFARDWGRVLCLDPQADLEVLGALQREIQLEVGMTKDRAALLRRMEDSFSNAVQLSPVMPVLTEELPALEFETAARMYLESPRLKRVREPAGRLKILDAMRNAFEDAGVLTLMQAVPAQPYTKTGDPFEFDFGYKVGGEIKLFHAVSVKAGVGSAVMLAARYPKIATRMAEVTQCSPLLTAVIDNDAERSREPVRFALEMMEEEKIKIAAVSEMPGIAEAARRELRA